MATQTIVLATADNARVRWEVDYDDVTNFLTNLRIINTSHLGPNSGIAGSRVWLLNNPSRIFPATAPRQTAAGVTETIAVPTTAALRLLLTTANHVGRTVVNNLGSELRFPL